MSFFGVWSVTFCSWSLNFSIGCHHSLMLRCTLIWWIMDPLSRAPKKNTNHGNEVLPEDTMHLLQKPCHQWGSLCQDLAGNQTAWRPPNHRKEMRTAVVWSCLPLIRSGQKPSCKVLWKGKEDQADRERGGKTISGSWQAWNLPSPWGQWRTGKNGGNWLWNHPWCSNDPCG